MNEEAELQAKIAALAGQINKKKQQPSAHPPPPPPAQNHLRHPLANVRGVNRWAPYGRGRGGRGGFAPVHKNRVLVLGGAQKEINNDNNILVATDMPSPGANVANQDYFVSHRAPGTKQLMTKEIFEREQRQNVESQEQREGKQPKPKNNIVKTAPSNKPSPKQEHVMTIEGIQFRMKDDGSKMIRISDPSNANLESPKMAKVANVEFFRTKHGNLVRSRAQQGTERPPPRKPKLLCKSFTKHGTCPFGPRCNYVHDPARVAICTEFLHNDSCKAGRNCDLSHDPTYNRVPACTYFLRGNCTKSACRYAHIGISPSSRVCPPFAKLGYCSKGTDCGDRHVFECPDYSNTGRCEDGEKGNCQLPHIDRAGVLRKAAQRQAKRGSEHESDISSSEDDQDPGDELQQQIDESDAETDIVMGSDDDSHPLSQQQDFVGF